MYKYIVAHKHLRVFTPIFQTPTAFTDGTFFPDSFDYRHNVVSDVSPVPTNFRLSGDGADYDEEKQPSQRQMFYRLEVNTRKSWKHFSDIANPEGL